MNNLDTQSIPNGTKVTFACGLRRKTLTGIIEKFGRSEKFFGSNYYVRLADGELTEVHPARVKAVKA
jgi:hypothetical protein